MNTYWAATGARCGSVHPRSRGEHCWQFPVLQSSCGSSPLARGTRSGAVGRRHRHRFIPARAGNTQRSRRPASTCTVHPRSRGEHTHRYSPVVDLSGSSPLARGTRNAAHRPTPAARFIPARAGNTTVSYRPTGTLPVHPRSRGEHGKCWHADAVEVGSSPLARGTPGRHRRAAAHRRFIPARAGNTCRSARSMPDRPVHPRSRGEHLNRPPDVCALSGSSPLARGTQTEMRDLPTLDRFIPARAGNTLRWSSTGRSPPVHPRSRGEHCRSARPGHESGGSSPLARGTPPIGEASDQQFRFIPARAGNTCTGYPQ